ncbi:MAG: magnesium chelatase domain-containing protein [Rickettsiales bacterium]|nr:magnesium chelatase domain-containing protein [Rickettsiales bacterium]
MIIAVLSSRFGLKLCDKEVYLNVVGGLQINEPGADLAVALALISAAKDKPLAKDCMVVGEIGLSGEIRMVSQIEARLKEAEKLGFTRAIVPEGIYNIKQFKKEKYKLKIITVKHVRDLAMVIF